jgi:thiol-disulfide isomerase/thioredoxin
MNHSRRDLLAAMAVLPLANVLATDSLPILDETGYRNALASRKGTVVLVNFWATWCAPCREELPKLPALEAKFRPSGFNLVLISADEAEQAADARKFLLSKHVTLPSYRKQAVNDEKFINSIDPKWSGALPAMFLYDRSGKRVQSFFGETEMPVIEAAIKKVLSQGTPPPPPRK